MSSVIPGRIMELIGEAEEEIRQYQEQEEARKWAEKVAIEAKSERVKQVFLDALPEDLRNYGKFLKESFAESDLEQNELIVDIEIPGLFPIRACLYRGTDHKWFVDEYQVATWNSSLYSPTFDKTQDDPDYKAALWIAKTLVDEARRLGWLREAMA